MQKSKVDYQEKDIETFYCTKSLKHFMIMGARVKPDGIHFK